MSDTHIGPGNTDWDNGRDVMDYVLVQLNERRTQYGQLPPKDPTRIHYEKVYRQVDALKKYDDSWFSWGASEDPILRKFGRKYKETVPITQLRKQGIDKLGEAEQLALIKYVEETLDPNSNYKISSPTPAPAAAPSGPGAPPAAEAAGASKPGAPPPVVPPPAVQASQSKPAPKSGLERLKQDIKDAESRIDQAGKDLDGAKKNAQKTEPQVEAERLEIKQQLETATNNYKGKEKEAKAKEKEAGAVQKKAEDAEKAAAAASKENEALAGREAARAKLGVEDAQKKFEEAKKNVEDAKKRVTEFEEALDLVEHPQKKIAAAQARLDKAVKDKAKLESDFKAMIQNVKLRVENLLDKNNDNYDPEEAVAMLKENGFDPKTNPSADQDVLRFFSEERDAGGKKLGPQAVKLLHANSKDLQAMKEEAQAERQFREAQAAQHRLLWQLILDMQRRTYMMLQSVAGFFGGGPSVLAMGGLRPYGASPLFSRALGGGWV